MKPTSKFVEHSIDPPTLVTLLREKARKHPDRRLYAYVSDDGQEALHLTYAELEARARIIAATLALYSSCGKRALLLYPPGLEFISAFWGCLYSGVVAVPAYPPHPARLDRTMFRLRTIAKDACPSVVLTTSKMLPLAQRLREQSPELASMRWIATDELNPEMAYYWRMPDLASDSLAFLQYTSGSTATPKGVMVTHGNLYHNQCAMQKAFQTSEATLVAGWLPLYHDMGLIGNVLHPLFVGASCVLMSPTAFLQRPVSWLELIARHRASISGGPNFAYDLCVRRSTPEERASLDLSSWKVAFNGAEPVRNETLQRFARAFEISGFRQEAFFPCYGLAEATLFVSGDGVDRPPELCTVEKASLEQSQVVITENAESGTQTLVSCGKNAPLHEIAIVDPENGKRMPENQVGEIWVTGPSIAQGYWKETEEPISNFRAFLADTGEGPFLKTGDLGFFHKGELFVTGRIKDLIIIRGRNHYPQDIEETVVSSHTFLRPASCGAFSIEAGGEERLMVVAEVEPRAMRAMRATPSAQWC